MVAGCRSLAALEALTKELSPASRRAVTIPRRLPDTTVRDVLVRIEPDELRESLRGQIRAAHRRRALAPDGLPWGVVSMDGKATAIRAWNHRCVQRQGPRGIVRTITAMLVSSRARVCLDACPIEASTNEMGGYIKALEDLVDAYASLDLFRVVMYDAGACSQANARATRGLHLHYVMVLNESQPTLHQDAVARLGDRSDIDPDVVVEDGQVRYRLYLTEELAGWLDWTHLRTVVRIRREVLDSRGRLTQSGERYFVSSLRREALSPRQWVTLLRRRWGVENNAHHTWDTVFAEDERTWIDSDARGALVVIMLRRLAYNLMALFRSHTLRSELARLTPWRDLIRRTYNALIAATPEVTRGLREPQTPQLEPG
jgi:hypothetical protein